MSQPTGGIIPEDALSRLTELFTQVEGASKPLSRACREAEFEFNSLVEKIHAEIVQPRFSSVTLTQFRSQTRRYCRARASKESPPFPCV
jgi:hypothetical protein